MIATDDGRLKTSAAPEDVVSTRRVRQPPRRGRSARLGEVGSLALGYSQPFAGTFNTRESEVFLSG